MFRQSLWWKNAALISVSLLFFLATLRADDPAHQQNQPGTSNDAAKQLEAIKKEYNEKLSEFRKAISEAKNPEERTKVIQEKQPDGNIFLEKVLKLLDDPTDDKTAWDALSWVSAMARSPEQMKKLEKPLNKLINATNIDALSKQLSSMPPQPSLYAAGIAIFKKVKDQPNVKGVEDLVAWAAQTTAYVNGSDESYKTYNETIEFLADKFPTSKHFETLAPLLATDDNPLWAQKQLRKILAANKEGKVHLLAQYALGAILASGDETTKEAKELLESFLTSAKGNDSSRDLQFAIRNAEGKLEDLKIIGSAAKEIAGADLQDKAIKLSDYKGKVVLLDFWGFW